MAEALGIAGPIVGMISLAEVIVTKGYRLSKSIKNCPKEVVALMDETSNLSGILIKLKCRIHAFQMMDPKNPAGPRIHADSLLSGCQDTLEKIDKTITKSEVEPGETFKNSTKRIQWKYRKEDVMELLDRIERHKTSLLLAQSLDDMESLQRLLAGNSEIAHHVLKSKKKIIQEVRVAKAELLSGLKEIKGCQIETQADQEQRRKDDRRYEALSWLSPIDFKKKHKQIQQRRCENTGGWFLESPEFTSWEIQSPPAVLWCKGHPGAGKTYMISAIVGRLESRFPDGDVGIAYIYCDFKQRTSQTPDLIFASVLQQLAYRRPNLNPILDSLYENCRKEGERPSLAELLSTIVSVSKEYNTVYIIFDALDECEEETQRKGLLASLKYLSQAPIKVLATSRPHPLDIHATFKDAGTAIIYAHRDDIRLCVERKITKKESTGVVIRPDLASYIVEQILLKSQGIFLLATFQIEHILRHPVPKAKRKAAQNLTSDLQAIYGSIMAAIEQQPQTKEYALSILRWVCAATRPLSFQELRTAISINDGDTEIDEEGFLDAKTMVDICGGLIAIEQETGTVRFTHYTVQEYLLTNGIVSDLAHYNIVKTCLIYFSFGISDEEPVDEIQEAARYSHHRSGKHPLEETCFWGYAAHNWGFHMRAISEQGDLPVRALDTLQSLNLRNALARAMCQRRGRRLETEISETTLLHIAAQLGLIHLLQLLLRSGDFNINSRDEHGSTPLLLAAQWGHEMVVKLLVDREDIEADSKDKDGRTPLFFAARYGHEAVVKLLVNRKDVNADSKDKYDWTPLSLAAVDGNEAVVKLLVDRGGVNANLRNKIGRTPLSVAAQYGQEAVVKLLVNRKGVDVDSGDKDGRTPLSFAAQYGHEEVVKLLVDRGVGVDSKDKDDRTPLLYAAWYGREAVVKLLVDRKGVDADSKDKDGRTPLFHAAWYGREAVVKLLADRKCVNADSEDENGRTPLSLAAESGHEAVVRLLVDRGDVDADSKDKDGWTPLFYAAENGHETVVKLLVDRKDVNVDSKDKHGWTLLSLVTVDGNEAVVKLLVGREGADAGSKDKNGRVPPSPAVNTNNRIGTKLLTEQTSMLRSILLLRTECGFRPVAKFLRPHRASPMRHEKSMLQCGVLPGLELAWVWCHLAFGYVGILQEPNAPSRGVTCRFEATW